MPTSVVRLLEVCSECPVRLECLREALAEEQIALFGAWGGAMMTERNRLLPPRQGGDPGLRRDALDRAEEILESTLHERIEAWRRRGVQIHDALLAGERRPRAHPTAHLLSKPERPVEDKSITSAPWSPRPASVPRTTEQ